MSMAAAARPMTRPHASRKGISHRLPISIRGMAKAGSEPNTIRETTPPLTAARMTGINPAMVYSINTTSMAKITPASGVLNDAAMAAATPQAASMRRLLFGNCSL